MNADSTGTGPRVGLLGYVRLGMRDPGQWSRAGQEILGFPAETAGDESIRLRMDDAPFRYLVEKDRVDRFICAGWECPADDFDALVSGLCDRGVEVRSGDAAACAARAVAAFVSFRDPSGNQVEVYHTRDAGGTFESLLGLSYVAGPLGLGHAVLPAPEHRASCEFYTSLLGFRLSDELVLSLPADAPDICINFYHANNSRHHSLGLINDSAKSGVVHLMTELESLDAVGACLDRVNAKQLPVTASLGRHVNDNMVSFYFLMPGDIPMEVGYDGFQLDWSDFEPTRSSVGDHWGHVYDFPA